MEVHALRLRVAAACSDGAQAVPEVQESILEPSEAKASFAWTLDNPNRSALLWMPYVIQIFISLSQVLLPTGHETGFEPVGAHHVRELARGQDEGPSGHARN